MKNSVWYFNLLPTFFRQKLYGRNNIITFIENSWWLIFDKILRLFLSLIVGTWVARYLGPAKYGLISYALAFIALFQAISTLGLDGFIVRDIVRKKNISGIILGTSFFLRLISGFVLWILASLSMILINGLDDNATILIIIIGFGLVFQSADVVDLWFQSQRQSKKSVFAKLIAYIVSNGIKIIFIKIQAPLYFFSIAILIESIFVASSLILSFRTHKSSKFKFSKIVAIKLLNEGWPLILSSVSIVIYMRMDQIFIKYYLGEYNLGIYAAVLPLATIWQFLPGTLATSFAPIVILKKNESNDAYWSVLRRIFNFYSLIGWLICVPMFFFSTQIVSILFGQKYILGSYILKIYVFSNLFINLGVAQSLWIYNEKKSIVYLYKTLIGSSICIIGNVFFLPKFGLYAAATIAVFSQAFSAVVSNIFFTKRILFLQLRAIFMIDFFENLFLNLNNKRKTK